MRKSELTREKQRLLWEDLYTAYYVVAEDEEIVADRDMEIPGMEENTAVEKGAGVVVEPDINVEVMNSNNIQNDIPVMSDIHNVSDVNMARMDEDITDVTGKSKLVEPKEKESVDKVGWIIRRISELGGYENVSDSVKADIFGLDIADVSSSIRLFSDVMKRLGIKLNGMSFLESFRRFMMRVLVEMLIKKRQKIRYGTGAEEDDSSAQFFQWIIICVISRTRNL